MSSRYLKIIKKIGSRRLAREPMQLLVEMRGFEPRSCRLPSRESVTCVSAFALFRRRLSAIAANATIRVYPHRIPTRLCGQAIVPSSPR